MGDYDIKAITRDIQNGFFAVILTLFILNTVSAESANTTDLIRDADQITTVDKMIDLANCSFKYSVKTTATRDVIWGLWADVKNWKSYDTLLEYSFLKEPMIFEKGAIGYVKASGAPKTKFEIIEHKEGTYFTESLKLPLYHSLELKRYFEVSNDGTTIFTHEVGFKGPLKNVLFYFLAKSFKKELPLVMNRLKEVAEHQEK